MRGLYDAGQAVAAHEALRKHSENNRVRAARQAECLADLRLWLQDTRPPTMQTLNGIGSRLLGREQPEDDGSYIATLWFAFLFIPLWPLRSLPVVMLTARGDESDRIVGLEVGADDYVVKPSNRSSCARS